MKKENVVDLAAYREELQRQAEENTPPSAPVAISEELKSAIETLIDKMRALDDTSSS